MLFPLLTSIFDEVKEFSKKKQNYHLNKFKVDMINKILIQVKELLKNDPTLQFLDLLDDVSLPTNSDVVLLLAHYKTSMEQFEDKYYVRDGVYTYRWNTKEQPVL